MYIHSLYTYILYSLQVDQISQRIFKKSILPDYRPPASYSGELFGVGYLYSQSGEKFTPDLNEDVENGLNDVDEDNSFPDGTNDLSEAEGTLAPPSDLGHRDDNSSQVCIHTVF